METLDKSGDGQISIYEFQEWFIPPAVKLPAIAHKKF
jgi:hypothetical protein